MATFGNKDILIKLDELPRINGERIEAIYRKKYDKRGVKDYTVRDEDAEEYFYCDAYFRLHSGESRLVRKLPEPLQKIFDEPQRAVYRNNETGEETEHIIEVSYISYRTKCSGHGGFIDDSITIGGVSLKNNTSHSISIRRNDKSTKYTELTGIYDKLIATLNIKAEIPELEEHEYKYYPTTTLRRVDNWNYPTPVCSGWRRDNKMPYVTLDDRKSLRVLNENLKCHVFLLKVEPEEVTVDEEYCIVNFGYDEDSHKYCFIKSWAHFKEDDPNGMIKYQVNKIRKSKESKTMVADCTVMGQEIKKYSKTVLDLNSFYRIVRIQNTEDLNN